MQLLKPSKIGWVGLQLALCLNFLASCPAKATSGFLAEGGESALIGNLAGDQTAPAIALGSDGGFVVWQDSGTDSDGGGIRARRINRTTSGSLAGAFLPFWVHGKTTGVQSNPQVALLAGGGAVFVWSAGPLGQAGIYARYLRSGSGSTPLFVGDEIEIAAPGKVSNLTPVVARLNDGTVVVAWSQYQGPESLLDVVVQRLSSGGQLLGRPFPANLTTDYNQRSPSVSALVNGGFVVAWVSENQRFDRSVDILARIYSGSGFPLSSSEMRLNYGTSICAMPSLAALPNGGFAAVWTEKDPNRPENGWDIFGRSFDDNSVALKPSVKVNDYLFSDQLAPKVAVAGNAVMAVWTSFGQDGYREGVFGRYLSLDGEITDDEFGLNQTVISQQLEPAIASDGTSRFVAVWTGFNSLDSGFDLVSRKFVGPAVVVAPKCEITQLSTGLRLSWSTESGANYQVQSTSDLTSWASLGTIRTASSSTDSLLLQPVQGVGFYRIVRLP